MHKNVNTDWCIRKYDVYSKYRTWASENMSRSSHVWKCWGILWSRPRTRWFWAHISVLQYVQQSSHCSTPSQPRGMDTRTWLWTAWIVRRTGGFCCKCGAQFDNNCECYIFGIIKVVYKEHADNWHCILKQLWLWCCCFYGDVGSGCV